MTIISLLIPTVCYAVASYSLFREGKFGLARAFGGYCIANFGLLAAAR